MEVTTEGGSGVVPTAGAPTSDDPPPLDLGELAVQILTRQMGTKMAMRLANSANEEGDQDATSILEP